MWLSSMYKAGAKLLIKELAAAFGEFFVIEILFTKGGSDEFHTFTCAYRIQLA